MSGTWHFMMQDKAPNLGTPKVALSWIPLHAPPRTRVILWFCPLNKSHLKWVKEMLISRLLLDRIQFSELKNSHLWKRAKGWWCRWSTEQVHSREGWCGRCPPTPVSNLAVTCSVISSEPTMSPLFKQGLPSLTLCWAWALAPRDHFSKHVHGTPQSTQPTLGLWLLHTHSQKTSSCFW
jgi:hypothetical protein